MWTGRNSSQRSRRRLVATNVEVIGTIGAVRGEARPRPRVGETIASAILIVLLLVLVAYPLASLLYGSFNAVSPDKEGAAFSAANFAKIFTDPQFWLAWQNTIIVSVASALIAMLCGLIAAFLIVRTDLPARG